MTHHVPAQGRIRRSVSAATSRRSVLIRRLRWPYIASCAKIRPKSDHVIFAESTQFEEGSRPQENSVRSTPPRYRILEQSAEHELEHRGARRADGDREPDVGLYRAVPTDILRRWCDELSYLTMPKTKVALMLDSTLLERVDELVARRRFRSRSQALEAALADKVQRLARTRLARESAKLDPGEEKRLAEQGLVDPPSVTMSSISGPARS